MGDQPVTRPLPTQDKANRINADIPASSGIRTHDLSVRAPEGMKFNILHQIWLLTEEFGMFETKVSKRRKDKEQETGA
jgi:hypothetical protein